LKFDGFDNVTKFDLILVCWNMSHRHQVEIYDASGIEPPLWTMAWFNKNSPENCRRWRREMKEAYQRRLERERSGQ
jgi:hypothetical protein